MLLSLFATDMIIIVTIIPCIGICPFISTCHPHAPPSLTPPSSPLNRRSPQHRPGGDGAARSRRGSVEAGLGSTGRPLESGSRGQEPLSSAPQGGGGSALPRSPAPSGYSAQLASPDPASSAAGVHHLRG